MQSYNFSYSTLVLHLKNTISTVYSDSLLEEVIVDDWTNKDAETGLI